MNKSTPKRNKSLDLTSAFSPVSLPTSPAAASPQKNLTGPPRIIRDIIADLYNTIQKWNNWHIQGCTLVKQIASLKADEPKSYTIQLEEYVTQLYTTVECLKAHSDFFSVLIKQAEAFAKLPNVNDVPVFFSLDGLGIARLVREVCESYRKEFEVKQHVLQNIAHTKNKNQAMFLAAYWTHQLNINESVTFKLESLLVESGHRPIK